MIHCEHNFSINCSVGIVPKSRCEICDLRKVKIIECSSVKMRNNSQPLAYHLANAAVYLNKIKCIVITRSPEVYVAYEREGLPGPLLCDLDTQ